MEYLDRQTMEAIRHTIYQAGDIIKNAHLTREEIRSKEGDANFVTAYDVRIQRYLIEHFSSLIPNASFLGEEDTPQSENALGEGPVFIIDPIDGTTNFMFDRRQSCISVAFCLGREVCCAWVLQPYTDEMWTAVKGAGACLNGIPLHAEDRTLEEGVASAGASRQYGYDSGPVFSIFRSLYDRCLGFRTGGSAAIDLCRVAAGGNVCYLEQRLSPWDYAAASLILKEAGCLLTQWSGARITLDSPCSVLAAPPAAHSQLRGLVDHVLAARVHLGSAAAPGKTPGTPPIPSDLIDAGDAEWEDETERTYRDGSLIQECWKDSSY